MLKEVERCFSLFCNLENFLTHSAEGAYPILGEFFKSGTRGDACFGIAYFGVINVVANGAKILFHSFKYFSLLVILVVVIPKCVRFTMQNYDSILV
jgi:hypothetical protein